MQKQITIYPEQHDIIDKLSEFNASEFFRWALKNSLQEYLKSIK